MNPHTPVLVGVGVADQRCEDPRQALESCDLMAAAVRAAAADAGDPGLLAEADSLRVPRGFWEYTDPGRLVAERVGASRARTVMAQIGVLQQTLINGACRDIASGREHVAVVVGGDTRYRSLRARLAGVVLAEVDQGGARPDALLEPEGSLWHDAEASLGLMMAAPFFALIESALRHADGLGVEEHRDRVAALWARMSEVAADNPHAWRRESVSAASIREATADNAMIAFPYTKQHNSDWNVDQAGALLLCSAEVARQRGIPEERWVYARAGTENNAMLPVSARPALHRSPGAEIAGRRALELAGIAVADVDHFDLYSCFPAAVQVFARELGVGLDRPLTVTGGMRFAGGPLNNYVIQATARMAEVLRSGTGGTGLVSSVSGFLNKQGYGIWSTTPPAEGFAFADVSDEVAAATEAREILSDYAGPATINACTVLYLGERPNRAIAVCDLPDGRRALAFSEDPQIVTAMTREEFCGRRVAIAADRSLRPA